MPISRSRAQHPAIALSLLLVTMLFGCQARTPTEQLRNALDREDAKEITASIGEGADVNDADSNGDTPLHLAAHWGHKKAAHELILNGADVNARNSSGRTPLYVAVENDHPKTVGALLEGHADPNLAPAGEKSALGVATAKGSGAVASMLRAHGAQ